MNTYSYQKVLDLIEQQGAITRPNLWGKWFQQHQPQLYSTIIAQTQHLNPRNFTDRLYCYTNGISQRPLCICGNPVTYNIRKKSHHEYCSQGCSMRDLGRKMGVDNVSQLSSVKRKKQRSAIKKYGVSNVSKAREIKNKIGAKAKERWRPFWEGVSHEEKNRYLDKVGFLTDRNYRKWQHILDPQSLRSNQWHLDHVYSKSDGFRNGVDPALVAHPANLRIIAGSENSRKNFRSDILLDVLIERIEAWDKTHAPLS